MEEPLTSEKSLKAHIHLLTKLKESFIAEGSYEEAAKTRDYILVLEDRILVLQGGDMLKDFELSDEEDYED